MAHFWMVSVFICQQIWFIWYLYSLLGILLLARIGKAIMKKAKFFSRKQRKYIFLTRFSNITSAKDFSPHRTVFKSTKKYCPNGLFWDIMGDENTVIISRYITRGKGKTVCSRTGYAIRADTIQYNCSTGGSREKEGLAKVIKILPIHLTTSMAW